MKRIILSILAIGMLAGMLTEAQATAPARRVLQDSSDSISGNGGSYINTWVDDEQALQARRQAPIQRAMMDVSVRKIIPRIPVIMVQFQDFEFSRTQAEVDSLFNGVNFTTQFAHATAQGSIRQYFKDQSNGQYDPQFDIYGPVTVDRNCCDNYNLNAKANTRLLVKEACSLVDSIVDFSQYDADQDGKIDLVYIYYAGFGANDNAYINSELVSNKNQLIWPHWSTTSGATYDGKQIRDYECANELDGYWTQSMTDIYPAGIGVAVHEFCHALGLPDLYPTNGTSGSFRHIGAYDVMDYGCYLDEMFCPASLSAYERWFLGWLTPTLINSPADLELGYIGDTNEAYLITADGQPLSGPHATTTPYYLLENRQKRGWDQGKVMGYDLLGHGLMIQRISFSASVWSSNTVNNDSTNQRVKLISADGDYGYSGAKWYAKKTDLFPAGATEYTGIEGFPITEITEDAQGVVHFKLMGGTPAVVTGDVNTDGTVDVSDISTLAEYIFGNTPAQFDENAADANGDGNIDVSDISTIAEIIFNN